jgi:putative ABC transport system ATP-binding protein
MLKTEKLTKVYQSGKIQFPGVFDIDLEIGVGEFVAVTGHSGAGKSTLMHLLGCLDTPSSGKYFLDGLDVAQLSPRQLAQIRNRKIGFVFQDFDLLPNLNAEQNVALPQIYGGIGESKALKDARELLEMVGLAHRITYYPRQLSGGQQQRVAIARALAMKPKLLLADEPTGNLDSSNAQLIIDLFFKLNQTEHVTVVMVTHEPEFAAQAQRVLVMQDGRLKEEVEKQDKNSPGS